MHWGRIFGVQKPIEFLRAGALFALLSCGAEAGAPAFRKHVLNAESTFSACAAIDVNGDGRLDVVCGGWWYQAPSWERHFVREVEAIRGRFDGYSHLPYDVDGDGYLDLINVNYRSQSIYWVRHPGEGLDAGAPWKKHTIAIPGAMETGFLADVDGDGALDILPNGTKFAAWWQFTREKRDDGKWMRRFVKRDLPPEVAGHGVGFGDIDGDGRGDIVGPKGVLFAPEDQVEGKWSWSPEFELERDCSIPMLVLDADGDGDGDILYGRGHNYGVYWLEQHTGGKRGAREWEKHVIDESWSQAHALLWEDIDGDGRNDLIAGKRYLAHEGKDPGAYDPLVLYWYGFDAETRAWKRNTISHEDGVGFGLDPKAVDLDADGDIDLVCPGRSGLYWMENQAK